MRYIKNYKKIFESLEKRLITDENEILKIIREDKPDKPKFDKTPNVKIGDNEFREISKKELDEYVDWIMKYEYVECYKKPTNKRNFDNQGREIPEIIEYPSYDSAVKISIWNMSGSWLDNTESFLNGTSIFKKDDVWWAMEGFRNYYQ